jgi:multiple sugar transport system ATP-binding protein
MVAGLEDITEGRVLIGDRVVNDVPAKDRDIAMVFQSYALYPHMSVYDNLSFGLKLRKTPKDQIDKRVREAAAILGLEQFLDRKPRALSGGQRQRVALGRAIVRQPKVFLMDEPLSNLDAKLRVQTRVQILKLHQRLETTFIYVTHDQVEAMTMGDRIVVMSAGLVQQVDTPQNLYHHPINMFVAGFIGSPAMNFLNVKIGGDGQTALQGENFQVPVAERLVSSAGAQRGQEVVMGPPWTLSKAWVVKCLRTCRSRARVSPRDSTHGARTSSRARRWRSRLTRATSTSSTRSRRRPW